MNVKLKTYLLLFFSMFLFIYVNAQTRNKNISGVILDTKEEPLIGVTITVKGTTLGTITDIDGAFKLNVPENGTIVISYVGYATKEVSITTNSRYVIRLEENALNLDEVVVIGYGTMRKKDLTGSITQIRPDNLANENPKTIQDILRGTPGLKVGFDTSAKGGGSLEIRGQRSVYTAGGHNSPLLVLDGMIFYGELSEINPDDIGQIDILKDASAAAIYGAKAANGVIIITTKKGKKGKPVINLTTNFGLTQKASFQKRWNPEEYMQHRQDFYETNTYGVNYLTGEYENYQQGITYSEYYTNPNKLSGVSLEDWRAYSVNNPDESDLSIWAKRLDIKGNALDNFLSGKTVDWANHVFRTGFNQDYNVSVSGAGDKANYYFSMGYLDNQGVVKTDQYQAIRGNLKVDFDVTRWLEVGVNLNFQDRSDDNIGIDVGSTLSNSPFGDYADADGNPIQYPLDDLASTRRGYNFDFQKQYAEQESGYTILNSVLNAKLKLPFNITYSFNGSPRYQFYYNRKFTSAALPYSDPTSRGVDRQQAKRFNWSHNNTLAWDYTFDKKHHVVLTLVQEAEILQHWSDNIVARNIQPSDALGFHNTQNGTKEDSSFSSSDSYETANALLARLFYSYDSRYMITTSVRRDGYSAFGSSNPYATFPSIATAWTFTNEKFYNWSNIMNYGKLRFSYGKNGNRSLSSPYLALANLSAGAGKMHGYLDSSGNLSLYRYLMVDRMANPNLQWEKTSSWNIGLDFGFLKGRLSGSIEYYLMQTHDMIMTQRIPEITGFSNITTNLGQVNNNGIEFSLNTLNIDKKNFKWNTTLGFSYNKNEIKHLYYEYENGKELNDETNGWFIGQPISAIWDYRVTGIWQKDEWEEAARYGQVPGDPKVANLYTEDDVINADGSVTAVYNDNDKEILGQTAPPIHWSLRNDFTLWKDLTFSFNLYSYMGHKSLSTSYMNNDNTSENMTAGYVNVSKKDYWTLENSTNEYGRIGAVGPTGATSPGKLINRSFIRLENISIGYTLPKVWTSKFEIERLKIFGSVRNVANWTQEWEYGDPETGTYAARTYSLGLNITF
ncbi:MAG: SusC/RagA family protein [Bacteroidales bacterium 36-12]|nr:MAG: SusC/RagA family protein [Bacteroidales bacterium 36-12]